MLIFDEKKYAENLLANGYKNKKYIGIDNIILVKYWKYIGLKEDEIRKNLKNFMNKFQELYNQDIIDIKADRAIRIGMMYDLSTGVVVEINDKEIELINTLESIELRKMMFILLVVWKFKGCPKRFRISNADLMRLSGVRVNGNKFWDYIHQLIKSQMISMSVYNNKDYYILNINTDGEVVLRINDFSNPIYYYMNLIEPDKYKKCENCRVIIKIKSNRQKYCRECWKERERQLRVNINKRYYMKNKIKTV